MRSGQVGVRRLIRLAALAQGRLAAAALVVALGVAAIGHHGVNAQEATFYVGPVAPLTAAVWQEQIDEVRRLLSVGVDPNAEEGKPAMTPWQVPS
jgi:hypothetical protein